MLILGPFHVATDGTLTPRKPGLRPVVRYAWRGRECAAEVTDGGLRLVAMAGRLPSTAKAGTDRGAVVRAVNDMRGDLPPGLRLHLLADHRVVLRGEAPPGEQPVAAHGLVEGMVRFALSLDPLLDRLEAAGA